ncbi:MAG: YdcF family protein [Candidatus Cyclonatronum sp.]|uniref:YdcF family protein n=1 Tax=Cyclonatronum sp. TaxID=3024185 RepID=UPI0025C1DB1E|nr:YdcF family protein [Cyclonatronum sp.]MCH8486068.1 YdcF family protein [Cyclonatronum sp.]
MIESVLRFIYSLLQPGTQLLLLFLTGMLLLFINRFIWAKRCLLLFVVLLFLYGLPWIPGYLADTLENRFPVVTDVRLDEIGAQFEASGRDSIFVMVLGAGHSTDPRLGPTQRLSETVMMRLAEAIRLYRALDARGLPVRLVTSAGGHEGQMTQAEALAQAAVSLGVPDGRISRLHEPRNTCGEARAFREAFGGGQTVFVSSSAIHQRRAVMLFEQNGSLPVAAPAAYLNRKSPEPPNRWWRGLRPSGRNVDLLELSVKEYIGYRFSRRNC